MPEKHYPGETVGIIGSSISSALLAQAAGKLGYRVGSLVIEPDNPVKQFSSWQTVSENLDEVTLRHFAGRVDVLITEKGLLSNEDFHVVKEITDVTFSEDLISITTDRLIEKVYLDSLQLLVAPFSLVTSLSDLQEAVEYIGFPCIIKSTNRHLPHANESVVLYSESEFDIAKEKIEQSTCIVEAWIPAEKKVLLTLVRNERGELLIYPIFELVRGGLERGNQIRYPVSLHSAIEHEILRIGKLIATSLGLIGSLTVEFFITSAAVVYVNEAQIGLNESAIFTVGSMSLSQFEGTIRALVGLPLPELRPRAQAAIALQVPFLNIDNVLTQFMLRTDWGFTLFNPYSRTTKDLVGQVIVTGDSLENCERQIDITELYRKDIEV